MWELDGYFLKKRGGKDKRFDICSTTTTFCKPTEVCLVVSVGHDGSFTVSQVIPVSLLLSFLPLVEVFTF